MPLRRPSLTTKKPSAVQRLEKSIHAQQNSNVSAQSSSPLSTDHVTIPAAKATSSSPILNLQQLNRPTLTALSAIANGVQKDSFLDLLHGSGKNQILQAAGISLQDSQSIDSFEQAINQNYDQLYQQASLQYNPKLLDEKFRSLSQSEISSSAEESELLADISTTSRQIYENNSPLSSIESYFNQKKRSLFPDTSISPSSAPSVTSVQPATADTSTATSTTSSSLPPSTSTPKLSSSTVPSHFSSSASSAPTTETSSTSAPASEKKTPGSHLTSSSRFATKTAEADKQTSLTNESATVPTVDNQTNSVATSVSSPTEISSSTSSSVSSNSSSTTADLTLPLSSEPSSTGKTSSSHLDYHSSPSINSPSPFSAETDARPSRSRSTINPDTFNSGEPASAGSPTLPSSVSNTSASSSSSDFSKFPLNSGSFTQDTLNRFKQSKSPSPSTFSRSTKTSRPLFNSRSNRQLAKLRAQAKQKAKQQAAKAAAQLTKAAIKAAGLLIKGLVSFVTLILPILPYIVVVASAVGIFTAVVSWFTSSDGPAGNVTIQSANQAPLADYYCYPCVLVSKTVSLIGGQENVYGLAIDATNAKKARYTYTVTPDVEHCKDIKLNGDCSDILSIGCDTNNPNCPELSETITYNVPALPAGIVHNANATEAVPDNYRLSPEVATIQADGSDLSVAACNELMRTLKTDNLHNYPLTQKVAFNLDAFLPEGYPLPYGNDYRLDNTFTLGYSGQPTNPKGTFSTINGLLEIHMVNVLWGDAILIRTQNQNIVIDGGSKGNDRGGKFIKYLQTLGISQIDTYILSHGCEDHVGNTETFFQTFEVGERYSTAVKASGYPGNGTSYPSFIPGNKALKAGDVLQLEDGLILEVLGPITISSSCRSGGYCGNNDSLVFRLTFGNKKFLFTGDFDNWIKLSNAVSDDKLQADFLKYPHHGRAIITLNYAVLTKIHPEVAFTYEIKNNAIVNNEGLMNGWGGQIYSSENNGNLVCVSDGNTLTVTTNAEAADFK